MPKTSRMKITNIVGTAHTFYSAWFLFTQNRRVQLFDQPPILFCKSITRHKICVGKTKEEHERKRLCFQNETSWRKTNIIFSHEAICHILVGTSVSVSMSAMSVCLACVWHQWSCCHPTKHFTLFESRNPTICVSKLRKIHWSSDLSLRKRHTVSRAALLSNIFSRKTKQKWTRRRWDMEEKLFFK